MGSVTDRVRSLHLGFILAGSLAFVFAKSTYFFLTLRGFHLNGLYQFYIISDVPFKLGSPLTPDLCLYSLEGTLIILI